jgi:hypothetical protein
MDHYTTIMAGVETNNQKVQALAIEEDAKVTHNVETDHNTDLLH